MARAARKEKDATNEFVVGSRQGWYEPSVGRVDTTDRVELRLDQELIDRLRLDGEIESNVGILADSVFADGLSVVPAVTDEKDSEFELAKEIADFITMATEVEKPIVKTSREMFKGAFYNGVKVAEIVLKYRNDSRADGKLVLDRINPKPNHATAFVTDKFYNVIGLVGARRPGDVASSGLMLSSDEIIPRDKFFVLDFEQEDNDPRGLSLVRACVEDYCDKRLTREQWKEWRRTSAIPKKFGTTAQGAKTVEVKDATGQPVMENGVRKQLTPQKALMQALEGYANNSSITAEFGTDVKQLEVNGTGVQFERHVKACNLTMRKVILGDSLATGEADKDARAARESSKDVVDIRKQSFRTIVADAIERNIFRLLTVVNFGEDKAHLTPKCFLGDTEANDWATDLQAASSAGYSFAPEHLQQLDAQFGLEPRENVEQAKDPEETDPNAKPDEEKVPAKKEEEAEETE